MGDKVKGWHIKAPKYGSKVMRDSILQGPKGGPHNDKRKRRQSNPKAHDEREW